MAQPNGAYIYGPPPAPPPRPVINAGPPQHGSSPHNGRGSWRGNSGRSEGYNRGGNNQHRGRGGMNSRGRGGSHTNQPHFYQQPQQSHAYTPSTPHYSQSPQQWTTSNQTNPTPSVSFFPLVQPQTYNVPYSQTPTQTYHTQPIYSHTNTNPQLISHSPSQSSRIPGLPQRPQRSYDDLSVEGRVRPPAAPPVPSFISQYNPSNPPIPLADFRQDTRSGRGGQRGFGGGRGRGNSRGNPRGGGTHGHDKRHVDPITKEGDQEYDLSPEELAVFRATGGKIKGTNLTLNDPEELAAWKEERRKKFPTRAKKEAKENEERERRIKEQNDDLQRRLATLTQAGTLLHKRKQEDETTSISSKQKRRKTSGKVSKEALKVPTVLIQDLGKDGDQDFSGSDDDSDINDDASTDGSDDDAAVPGDTKIKEILATSGIAVTAIESLDASANTIYPSESDDEPMSDSDSKDEPEVASAKVPVEPIPSYMTDSSKQVCYKWIAGRCQKKDCAFLHEGKQRTTKKERKAESERKRAEQGKHKKDNTKKTLYQMLRENDMEKENIIVLQAIKYLIEQGAL